MSIIGTVRRWFGGRPRIIEATSYDAARVGGHNQQHWGTVDALDADASNSLVVRQRISHRARYEVANNGQGKGVTLTQANYVVGRGPLLRMKTRSPGYNAMVEAAWLRWTKAIRFSRKLRTAVKAKVTDGETFLIARTNPGIHDRVKLDLVGIEAEQCTSPYLPAMTQNRVDGIVFDEYGNPLYYEILKHHPGSQWSGIGQEPEHVPARFVFHLFREDRPGQHRAVSELSPTLNLFADGRRYREATVAAAENIANFSILLKTQNMPNTAPDYIRPLSSFPIEKSMMVALPTGHDAFQPKAEQPAATHEAFTRSLSSEQARPINMPYNIAAADSSGYSFSGGRLDHLTYFVSLDTEQADIEDMVLDPVFSLWYPEAVQAYGWTDQDTIPAHAWDWPRKPTIDETKTATARKTDLGTGVASLSRIYAENCLDFEDEVKQMAEDYGITVPEMRATLRRVTFPYSDEKDGHYMVSEKRERDHLSEVPGSKAIYMSSSEIPAMEEEEEGEGDAEPTAKNGKPASSKNGAASNGKAKPVNRMAETK